MKILAIRLKNLASLAGPVEIDFTAEPLASAGLFAITGPTGAGKSTLLDALCLALFGTVPRLNDLGRETKVPDAEGDIATSDPRNLLRRGTGSGYAEVDFVGVDGRRYRARWEANRARDKANGKLQNSRQSLYDLDSEQLLGSGKQEYKELLETRLGLNFEQFTRAVMLAQSEFSAFLKANDKDRSELLEKLTNTSIYTRLGQRAFSKATEAKKVQQTLLDRASHVQPMASEARAELEQTLLGAQQQFKADQDQQRQLERQRAWAQEQQQLQAQFQAAQQALAAAEQQVQGLAAQRSDLQRLEQLAPQRHQFQREQQVMAQLQPLAAALAEHLQQQTAVQARRETLEGALATAAQTLAARQQQDADSAPRLRQAFAAQDTRTRLQDELSKAGSAVEQAEQACAALQQQREQLEAAQQRDEAQLTQLEQALTQSAALATLGDAWQAYRGQLQQVLQIANRLSQGREELPALQAQVSQANAQVLQQRQALDLLYREGGAEPQAVDEQLDLLSAMLQDNRKQQRAVDEAARLHGQAHDVQQRLDTLKARQQHALQQRQQLIQDGTAAKTEHATAEQALAVTRQLLERQRLARHDSVEALRAQLREGEPCSVCGSLEHPFHQPEALLHSLGQHDEAEQAAAVAHVQQLAKRLDTLRSELGGVNGQLKAYQQEQTQLDTQWQPLQQQLEALALWPALQTQEPAARGTWLDGQARRLEQEIHRDEQRQQALNRLQRDAAQATKQLHAGQEAQQHAEQRLGQQHAALAADQQRLDQAYGDFAEVLPNERLQALREQPAEAFMALDQQLSERLQQLEQRREQQQEHQRRQQQLERLLDQQQGRSEQQQQLRAQLDALTAQHAQAHAALADLLGEHASAEAWQSHVQQQLEHARSGHADTERQLQTTHTEAVQLASELKAKRARQHELEQEHQQLQQAIAQWRAAHADLDDAGLERLLAIDDTQRAALRQGLQDADSALDQARIRVQEREQRLQQHQQPDLEPLPADALEQALAETAQRLAHHEQHCAELRAQQAEDQRRQQVCEALAAEIAHAEQHWQRWARLNALIGSASGDVFRKIAQGYNLDLLLHHANTQLRQLARRYRLKRGGSALGLLVMDTEMGDELRSVHSLSGGETFLVSLALALGLASMASSTLRIESLFIDEGFGSLDPESLQLAMDALDGLQAQGRKVAVISHVQEMHERIPVQIQVRRQGNGLSDVEVCG
ncbi:AAA family ATPase [Pseudomonas sp. RP23018S]|uniref:AAA family ATPase n=1 Tax=Pseudomonas sp. RP23018S TaxID=3096037 RepID=UPI002ACA1F8A|nr:AAA family ATPase [Pseudomonas sp. RP23018S]MDZ5602247.1 AAA family ATPase [Pseudomonas sp. RP23018S]